jgi:hypothetical protein
MHLTIRNYAGGAPLADALLEHEDEVRGVITGIDGFRAYYLIRDEDGVTTVSVFDDEAGAEASTRAAAEWVRENLGDLHVSPPQVTSGKVELGF